MATAGMNKKTPLKVIPYKGKFKKKKKQNESINETLLLEGGA